MQLQTKKNSSTIKQNWTDNSTLDEIVKFEHRKNKSESFQKDLELLNKNHLKFLSDWKKVRKESKKKFSSGFVNFLDEKAGIIQVRCRKIQLQKDETTYLGTLSEYFLYFFGSKNMESNIGKDHHAQDTLEDSFDGKEYHGINSLRKRK
jgi:hypothetical protein